MFIVVHRCVHEDGVRATQGATVAEGYKTFSGAVAACGRFARAWAAQCGFGTRAARSPCGWVTIHRLGPGRKARMFNCWDVASV